jgi:hypothetical protein
VLALATGVAFGLVPALSLGRVNVQGTLRDEARGASEGARSRQLRGLLVAGQVALCVSLLAGAGLLTRSLWRWPPRRSASSPAACSPRPCRSRPAAPTLPRRRACASSSGWKSGVRGIPGVTAVAVSGDVPTRVMSRNGVAAEGAEPAPGEPMAMALFYTVSDDFFRTLGVSLVAGRAFGPQDRAGAPDVVIVSRQTASRLWPGEDAVGKRLRIGPPDAKAPWMTVVGVVGDVANDPEKLAPDLTTYHPHRQMPWNGPVFLLRTRGDPATLARPVERALAEIDRTLPLRDATPMRALIAEGSRGAGCRCC